MPCCAECGKQTGKTVSTSLDDLDGCGNSKCDPGAGTKAVVDRGRPVTLTLLPYHSSAIQLRVLLVDSRTLVGCTDP